MKGRILSASLLLLTICVLAGCISGNKQFAYATGPGTNEVFQFQVHSNGGLTPLNPGNVASGSNPRAVAIRPAGDFAYIANFAGNNVTLLAVNKGNGQLSVPVSTSPIPQPTPSNIFTTGTGPVAVAPSPAAPFLYVLNKTDGDISAFTIDPQNGNLTIITQPGTSPALPFFGNFGPNSATSMAITPKGNFLYVTSLTSPSVSCFSIDSNGLLKEVKVGGGPCFLTPAGTAPTFVTTEASGRFLYVADSANNQVMAFSIGSDGTITPVSGSPFAAGSQPVALAASPQGAFLYVANQGSNNVSAFLIDANSGALAPVAGSPFATGGRGPTFVAASGSFVYVTEQTTNDIAAFAIGSTGALAAAPGSPFNVPVSAQWISLSKE